MINKTARCSERAFQVANGFVMLLIVFVTLYPFWYVVAVSFSSISHAIGSQFLLWPDGIHLDAYQQIFRNSLVPTAYRNTIFVTVTGTVVSMSLTILGAYVLSIRDLPGREGLTLFIVFTMLFGGGLIPTYLVVSSLRITNTLWALILPCAISAYNLLLLRNFFQSIPSALFEAAQLDGISMIGYLFRILLPLSGASLATISMFYAVGYWNNYINSVIYLRDTGLWPMQMVLRQVLATASASTMLYDDAISDIATETLKNGMIVVSVLPILLVYPFVQKYFVKGVMVGSLKG